MLKNFRVLVTISLFLLLLGWQATEPTLASPSESGVTKALIQQILDAWSTMDTNKIAPFYAKDPGNIFFDTAPMQYKGWDAWAKDVQNLHVDYRSFKLSLTGEPSIHNQGDWAWATYLWHLDAVRKDGKPETRDGRDTAIWQKVGGRWLTVHEHVSFPVADAPAGNQ